MTANGERDAAPRVLVVAGTRPECLKLVSLVQALKRQRAICMRLMNSGQHAQMVERTFAQFGIVCDLAPIPASPAALSKTIDRLRTSVRNAARASAADLVVAQGDTATAYATALAARDLDRPLAHVEAGLRTDHPLRPFPEEYFRRKIARIATLHFAPTIHAACNLFCEGAPVESVRHVGNTIVDVLRGQLQSSAPVDLPFLPNTARVLTLTLHRRENYGHGLDVVCSAMLDVLARNPDLGVVCPVHPNPVVGARIRRCLADHPRIVLTEPLDYAPFIALLARSNLIVTDSGGIQEEAPYLGTPVLVTRTNTERPESTALGHSTLVSVDHECIIAEIERLLVAPRPVALRFERESPYGDGLSGKRCALHIAAFLTNPQKNKAPEPVLARR